MIRKLHAFSPTRTSSALLLILCITLAGFGQRGRQNTRADRNRSVVASRSTRNDRQRTTQQRGRASNRRERASSSSSSRDRRGRERGREDRQASTRRGRESRRAMEARRRREREEAARRAELARQARLAAIARQRAADQALRDETTANISRDDMTGEDLQVRQAAITALGNHAGTVVVMNPQTGRIYSIVNQDWGVRRGWKPCSTIKLVTGLAGISENVIGATENVQTSAGRSFRLDLTDSLAYSNNTYFQMVGGRIGFDRMMSYARQLGLGERTGVNHINESAGRIPLIMSDSATYRMSSHGDNFEVTPMQLAVLVSAIANGGNLLTPHLPRSPEENTNFRTEVRRRLMISPEILRRVVPGMIGAVNYGTARGAYDVTQTIAGKTGTCIGQGSWLGLFASYAPVHNPQLAVVVVTRGSGERGRIAASVAGRVFRSLNSRFGTRAAGSLLATTPTAPIVAPRPRVDAATAAALSDEEREANESTTGGETNTMTSTGVPPVRQGVQVMQPVPPQTRPMETTTQPVTRPSTNPAQPSASPSVSPSTPDPSPGRPRRVLTTSP